MRWYYNMKIGSKLILGFLIVAIIAGAIGVIGVVNIRTIEQLDTKLYETMTVPLGEMVIITESYHIMRGNIKDILLSSNKEEIADYENRIAKRNEAFDTNLKSFEKTLFTDKGIELTKSMFEYKGQYDIIVQDIIKLVKEGKHDQAMLLVNGEGNRIRLEIEKIIEELVQIKVNAAKETSDGNTRTATNATTQTIVLIIFGMAISVFLGLFISSSIKKPVYKLMDASKKIAEGDLCVTIDINSEDEIGTLAKSFRNMAQNMNDVMSNINSAADQVASGAKQVSTSSQALSQGATEQASSIEELTASLEEISSQTKLNAENANVANELAENAKTNASQGSVQMSEMSKAMEEINNSSSNISKIIKVIDEIAFQTNILALNAAVEAARAGQHGKGFAVVAEEVRNLAARSANAAKETTAMIEGSIKKVEGGTKIAKDTSEAFNKIVDGIGKVANLVGDIAVASNEQASGIAQVNQGIMQVSEVIQTNSATSEESAAASEELASQADMLKEQVSRFKLVSSSKYNKTYKGLEDIDPEVFKTLEYIQGRNKTPDKIGNVKESAISKGKKIDLSDNDFGKY